jgi:hypothetical protein
MVAAHPALRSALLLLLVCGLLASGCGRTPRRPNVVLLSLDTVRADHLGCYGYARKTSPRLDAFAAGATRYQRSLASASWTLPTHASLFTGRYAFEHGAHGLRSTDPARSLRPLDPAAVTLAEVFRDHGYATAGLPTQVSPCALRPQPGLRKVPAAPPRRRGANSGAGLAGRRQRPLRSSTTAAHRPYDIRPRAAPRLEAS